LQGTATGGVAAVRFAQAGSVFDPLGRPAIALVHVEQKTRFCLVGVSYP
jgi:hypothetical protein